MDAREAQGEPGPERREGGKGFLLALDDRIREIEDPFAVMETAIEMLARHLDLARVGYGEIDAAQAHVTIARDYVAPPMPSVVGTYRLRDFGERLIADLAAGRSVAVADVAADPRTAGRDAQTAYAAISTRALLAVPLVKNAAMTAMLFIHQPQPRPFSAAEIGLVEEVAERTWSAVERARAEAALRESEARYRALAEALRESEERLRLSQEAGGVGLWDWNLKSGELYWSATLRRLLGVAADAPVAPGAWELIIHPDDAAVAKAAADAALAGAAGLDIEFRIVRPTDGRVIWLASRGEVFFDAHGRPIRVVGVNYDITPRKLTETALWEGSERLQLAMRAADLGDWRWEAESDLVTMSERAAEMFGIPAGPYMTWKEMQGLIHRGDAERAAAAVASAIVQHAPYDVEYRLRRPTDGAEIWVAAKGRPTFAADGGAIGMIGVVQDVTGRKRAQERQRLLIRELHHRVKNTLATVQAVVSSTARTATSIDDFYEGFVGRIVSLARTHNLLTEDDWQNASLGEMVRNELGPYDDAAGRRVSVEGPAVELPSEAAVPIGMAVHELTTNAVKHGALATPGGRVAVEWRIEPCDGRPFLVFAWREREGGPVAAPTRQGFGSRLLQRVLTTQLQAEVSIDYDPAGLAFSMRLPLPKRTSPFEPTP